MNNLDSEVPSNTQPELPFRNLFLNAGVVNGLNKPWMYVLGVSLVVFAYLLIGSIFLMPLMKLAMNAGVTMQELTENQALIFDSEKLGINKNIILMVQFGLFVAAFVGLVVAVRFIHQKRFISVLTGYDRFRFKHFFFAFGIWAVVLVTALVVTYFAAPDELVWQFNAVKFVQLFFVCIIFLPIQTLVEEVLFRGYLLQGLSQVFKNGWVPLLITSLLFAMAHLSNPEISAYGKGLMVTYYLMFALFLGVITLLSEGLELAYGIHLANNLLSALFITSKNSVLKTDALFFAKTEDAGAELVFAMCALIAVFVLFWIKYRWRNFSLIIK
jgi:uncharacterized protein